MTNEITIYLTVTGEQGSPRVPLQISTNISAAELLKAASETTRIPLGTLKLIFRGRLIASDESKNAVEEYKMESGCVLHCMGKPQKDDLSPPVTSHVATSPSSPPLVSASVSVAAPSVPTAPSVAPGPTLATDANLGDPLRSALQAMRAANSSSDYQTAVQVLDKLLGNIMSHPLEEKYRRVKKQNPAFQRRLGGIQGGEAVLLAAGFMSATDESGADIFVMQASEEAWPRLQAAKAKVEQAVREANATRTMSATAMPPLDILGTAGTPASGGFMNPASAAMLSDPSMLQNMLQNPMFRTMLQNDPRIANNPMMQRALQDLADNPQILSQLGQVMQNPQMRQQLQTMMQNPQMMQAMEQQMRSMGMPQLNASHFPNFMPPSSSATNANPATGSAPQQQPQPSASDEDMTEEEMIAEAIRRSLQDQFPPP